MINSFKSELLEQLWTTGDTSLLSSLYVYEAVDILSDLDNAIDIFDLELLGYSITEYEQENWAL